MEEFRPVVGYEGYYEVSNLGRVKRLSREVTWVAGKKKDHTTTKIIKEKIMTQYGWSTHGEEKKAYDIVLLCKDCKQKRHYVHQLVAEAFLPNPYAYRFVRHKDGNGHNNYVNNLCWAPNCSKKLSKIN